MISAELLALARCPACRGPLVPEGTPDRCPGGAPGQAPGDRPGERPGDLPGGRPGHYGGSLRCENCDARYPQASRDYLDLRPPTAFAEQTKYLDEALHQDARHESVSPPLLQSGVRQRQLRRFLQFAPGDRVIDLGCGSGRSILWNAASGATFTGVDVSPFFAHEARATADLALADLRQLPFADGSFTKAYALDVLEHLSPEALDAMLAEAARVLAPGGALFVYSHVRKNAPIAKGLRAINALARGLERVGLIDMTQERLRKSDHLNPLQDVPHLEAVVARAGFRIAQIRYYTPIVGGFVENILMRMAERALARRADRRRAEATPSPAPAGPAPASPALSSVQSQATDATVSASPDPSQAAGLRDARLSAKARLARGGLLVRVLQGITVAMDADLVLFGRIRSGPFFARLEKR
jgi:ubiquinone/menaquinone biosynthesis C-methylase UbiE